jgi:hypothetical protein
VENSRFVIPSSDNIALLIEKMPLIFISFRNNKNDIYKDRHERKEKPPSLHFVTTVIAMTAVVILMFEGKRKRKEDRDS